MMNKYMSIAEQLLHNRPTLSANSIKTYESSLRNMYKKVFGDEAIDKDKFFEIEKFRELLKSTPPSSRKSKYSALYILTGAEQYQELMMDDIEDYNSKKAERQPKEGQIAYDEILAKCEEYKGKANAWFKAKNLPNLQDYLILSLYGGQYIPPRRALDYTAFKLRNIDESRDNFLQLYTKDKKMYGRFVFNEFKTKKRGQDVVEVPPELVSLIRKWKRLHDSDWLFFNGKKEAINSVVMNQRIERIFGKKVGVNGFRHAYMTHKYGHTVDTDEEMEQDFKDMGSSANQKDIYINKSTTA